MALVMLVTLGPAFPEATGSGDDAGLAGVRATDKSAGVLLAVGLTRSKTFRAIVDEIKGSDVIVYVDVRPLDLPGQLQFVSASSIYRFLRVSVRRPGLVTEQTAWLAHELWHAVEIARVPEVRDAGGLRRLYERIGDGGRYGGKVESVAAQEIWTKVLVELRGAG